METCGEVVGVADVVGALEEAIAEVVAREFEEEGEIGHCQRCTGKGKVKKWEEK